jgi:antitoxin component of RelBE/YafQ-DinJ toxin-antitoxin module
MSQKISVRLHPTLSEALQQAARDRGVSPSTLVRTALHQFLGPSPPAAEPSGAPPPDAWEAVLARCPSDVQAKIRQAIDRTGLALGDVLRALLISAAHEADTWRHRRRRPRRVWGAMLAADLDARPDVQTR